MYTRDSLVLKHRPFVATVIAAFFALFGLTGGAQAALESRLGGQAVYDTDLDITWLADANAGAGSAFDDGASTTDGKMTWANANAWTASLSLGGFTDWRLPITPQPDASCDLQFDPGGGLSVLSHGLNCTGSEMGHLFYPELGGIAGSTILISSDPDLALFTNIQQFSYWSVTELVVDPDSVWAFNFNFGIQQLGLEKVTSNFAWAVRDGDVEPSVLKGCAISSGMETLRAVTPHDEEPLMR